MSPVPLSFVAACAPVFFLGVLAGSYAKEYFRSVGGSRRNREKNRVGRRREGHDGECRAVLGAHWICDEGPRTRRQRLDVDEVEEGSSTVKERE
jgi:hypothetical protein